MAKTEANHYQVFRKVLLPLRVQIHRIENAVVTGTFDVAVSRVNKTLWVELKRSPSEDLEVSQFRWALERLGFGCSNDMIVVCRNIDRWNVYTIIDILRADGKLSHATPVLAAAGSVELRLYVERKFTYG